MRQDYRRWLERQDYSANTINTQVSHASRLEQAYGDLDEIIRADQLDAVLTSLRYTAEDSRRGSANPSKLAIGGDLYKSLASFRTAFGLYARFTQDASSGYEAPTATQEHAEIVRVIPAESRERIGLERDLQKALRREIDQLEPGLSIVDDGVERSVASGFIDITARDANGATVVIELKAGTADRTAIGQILSYMGDLVEEDGDTAVRGILVAHHFDLRAKSAARMIPNLRLRSYAVRFAIGDPLA